MKLSETMRRIPLIVEHLLAASFVLLLVRVLYFVLGNSAIEWPFEYREFASVSFTGALLDGINPYALEHEPYFTNVYGPLYNLLVWPWAALAGNGFQVHRLVSLFFLGAGSALLYFLIRRGRGGRALALCAGVVFFLAQTDDVAGLARPDGRNGEAALAFEDLSTAARCARQDPVRGGRRRGPRTRLRGARAFGAPRVSGFALVFRERCFTTVLPHGCEWIGRSVHVAARPLGDRSRHVDMESVLVRDLGCD